VFSALVDEAVRFCVSCKGSLTLRSAVESLSCAVTGRDLVLLHRGGRREHWSDGGLEEAALEVEALQDGGANRRATREHARHYRPLVQQRLESLDRVEGARAIVAAERVENAAGFDHFMR
jgi:hypothetical protein